MVKIYGFPAVRPAKDSAQAIAAVPYDVVTSDEARRIIAQNPLSFLRVSRADAELPDLDPHDGRVYDRARENFIELEQRGLMVSDPSPALYIYRVLQDGQTYLGLACCLDVGDYRLNRIRKHEQTRYDKEEDRTRHIERTGTHNGPVVLLFRNRNSLFVEIESLLSPMAKPDAEVAGPGGSTHQIFRISDPGALCRLQQHFSRIDTLFIADGHHRAKSAVNVSDRHPEVAPDDEMNRFLGVLFAHDRIRIHGYSRLLTDLGAYSTESFLDGLRKQFAITEYGEVDGRGYQIPPRIPEAGQYHIFHCYLDGRWYECTRRIARGLPLTESLDVSVLQNYVLEGMLGIRDPRVDARLQYLGGARPIRDLMHLVDTGEYVCAIAMQPVNVETVLSIADSGGIMPPKSTWFEPKLLSGLLVHKFR